MMDLRHATITLNCMSDFTRSMSRSLYMLEPLLHLYPPWHRGRRDIKQRLLVMALLSIWYNVKQMDILQVMDTMVVDACFARDKPGSSFDPRIYSYLVVKNGKMPLFL